MDRFWSDDDGDSEYVARMEDEEYESALASDCRASYFDIHPKVYR
jgi:hypothetical protein